MKSEHDTGIHRQNLPKDLKVLSVHHVKWFSKSIKVEKLVRK
jgi:hypothetical protein